jgi:hypothetical protein
MFACSLFVAQCLFDIPMNNIIQVNVLVANKIGYNIQQGHEKTGSSRTVICGKKLLNKIC